MNKLIIDEKLDKNNSEHLKYWQQRASFIRLGGGKKITYRNRTYRVPHTIYHLMTKIDPSKDTGEEDLRVLISQARGTRRTNPIANFLFGKCTFFTRNKEVRHIREYYSPDLKTFMNNINNISKNNFKDRTYSSRLDFYKKMQREIHKKRRKEKSKGKFSYSPNILATFEMALTKVRPKEFYKKLSGLPSGKGLVALQDSLDESLHDLLKKNSELEVSQQKKTDLEIQRFLKEHKEEATSKYDKDTHRSDTLEKRSVAMA